MCCLGAPPTSVMRLRNDSWRQSSRLAPINDTMQEDAVSESAIEARILDARRTPAGRHVVVLAAAGTELPIWIGAPEAEALVAGLQDVELPRPNAHALALSLLEACGRRMSSVRVCRLDAAIFYAEVVLDDGTTVDARPSDALVLAVAAGLPIELDRAVLDATRDALEEVPQVVLGARLDVRAARLDVRDADFALAELDRAPSGRAGVQAFELVLRPRSQSVGIFRTGTGLPGSRSPPGGVLTCRSRARNDHDGPPGRDRGAWVAPPHDPSN